MCCALQHPACSRRTCLLCGTGQHAACSPGAAWATNAQRCNSTKQGKDSRSVLYTMCTLPVPASPRWLRWGRDWHSSTPRTSSPAAETSSSPLARLVSRMSGPCASGPAGARHTLRHQAAGPCRRWCPGMATLGGLTTRKHGGHGWPGHQPAAGPGATAVPGVQGAHPTARRA